MLKELCLVFYFLDFGAVGFLGGMDNNKMEMSVTEEECVGAYIHFSI